MGSRLIGGLEEDVARRYVNLYERLTHISGEICALGKAIEILSLQDNAKEVGLNYLGSIIEEKGHEIDNLMECFVSYSTIYLELKGVKSEDY